MNCKCSVKGFLPFNTKISVCGPVQLCLRLLMGGLRAGKQVLGRQSNRVGIRGRGERLDTNGQIGSDSLTPMGHSPLQGVYEALACVATSTYERK